MSRPSDPPVSEPSQLLLATVDGEPWLDLPKDLYIPPDALEIIIERFEGPLDLLLYLIRKQKLNIVDLPITSITRQYMSYVEAMKSLKLELAADYLVMAALLAEIKSRMLLPKPQIEAEECDPRAELIRRLQEYELYKDASEKVDSLPRIDRDHYVAVAMLPEVEIPKSEGVDVSLTALVDAMQNVLERASQFEHHAIMAEELSTRQRMSDILKRLTEGALCDFITFFTPQEGRRGVVVSFLAILALIKSQRVRCVQSEPLGTIWLSLNENSHHEASDEQS